MTTEVNKYYDFHFLGESFQSKNIAIKDPEVLARNVCLASIEHIWLETHDTLGISIGFQIPLKVVKFLQLCDHKDEGCTSDRCRFFHDESTLLAAKKVAEELLSLSSYLTRGPLPRGKSTSDKSTSSQAQKPQQIPTPNNYTPYPQIKKFYQLTPPRQQQSRQAHHQATPQQQPQNTAKAPRKFNLPSIVPKELIDRTRGIQPLKILDI